MGGGRVGTFKGAEGEFVGAHALSGPQPTRAPHGDAPARTGPPCFGSEGGDASVEPSLLPRGLAPPALSLDKLKGGGGWLGGGRCVMVP